MVSKASVPFDALVSADVALECAGPIMARP
ncbi:hypothetical protein ABID95_002382 [Streptomyces atratus]